MSNTVPRLEQTDLHEIGNEQTKVIRVVDVFADPQAIIDRAEASQFARINPHYPGIRAAIDASLLNSLSSAVAELASTHLGYEERTWEGQAWYSIVTQPPGALTPIQRLPHFDGFDEDQVAIMIYLNQTQHGGTAFFRHRSTGFECVTEPRYPKYKSALEADVGATGLPPALYITDGAPHFEKITAFDPAFNSMILYAGVALHSGVIDNALPLPDSPRAGRLTLNGFFRPMGS